jgi:predicted sulfurtransferase
MKQTGPMRWLVMMILSGAIIAGLAACNSNETLLTQKPINQSAPPASPPADGARRITADELHKLWEKNDVMVIDTRPEPAYKQEHIKGAISMPTGTVLDHVNDLPRNKLIAAYCT